MSSLHLVRIGALLCLLGTALPVAQAAQKSDGAHVRPAARGSMPSHRAFTPRTGRVSAPRAGRVIVPRTNRLVLPPGRYTIPRKHMVVPQSQGQVRRAVPPLAHPSIRKAPSNLALVNSGLRRNPGQSKPAQIQHDAKRKAGKSGWAHRHRPFFFKHAGHRWRRHYYSFLVGGLWYWYWYDLSADTDPDVVVYADSALPDCDPDSDECVEPAAALVAPAILEGRATEEDMARCAARFRSFDRETGTFVAYGGEVRICPYLE